MVLYFRYTFEVGPVFTLIELKLLGHILKLFGIPDGDGIFSPGGSISILYGLVAARYKAYPDIKAKGMRNLPEMVIFTSEDVSKVLSMETVAISIAFVMVCTLKNIYIIVTFMLLKSGIKQCTVACT